MDGCEDALSVLEVVSFVAGNASPASVEGVALVGDFNADSLIVEHPIVGALKTEVVLPVPRGTSLIGWVVVAEGDAARAFAEVVSVVAARAEAAISVPSGAEVGDGCADTVLVEVESARAFETGLLVGAPKGTSWVRGG